MGHGIWSRITFGPERKASREKLEILMKRYSEIVLLFPNDTAVKICGDAEVVKQIVEKLDGLVVEYTDDLSELLPTHTKLPQSGKEKK